MRLWMSVGRGLVATLLLGGSGCSIFKSRPPSPLPSPSSDLTVTHFWGTPLSGPQVPAPNAPASTPAAALQLHITWLGLATLPTNLPPPLGASARLILASRHGQPVQPTAVLTLATHYAEGADAVARFDQLQKMPAQKRVTINSVDDLLPAGATSAWFLTDTADMQAITPHEVELDISRPPATTAATKSISPVELALGLTDAVTASTAASDSSAESQPRREQVLFDAPGGPLPHQSLLILPLNFAHSPCKGLAILLTIQTPDSSPGIINQFAQITDDLKLSATNAAAVVPGSFAAAAMQSNVNSALSAMTFFDQRRQGLVYLAGRCNAPLCQDVAMVADNATLQQLSNQIIRSTRGIDMSQAALLGSLLDVTTMQWLAKQQAEGKLSDVLTGVLLEHTGEAGRHSSSLELVCKNLSSQADLRTRLIAENLIYLEDSSPASRVRAYDWLAARGQAPAGYDPLGPARQRRDALEKALAQPHQ